MEEEISEEVQVAPVDESSQQEEARIETHQESSQDRNWRELNRAKKELERKTRMQEELLERLMSQQARTHAAPALVEEDELDSIPDDDHLVKGQSRKLVRREVAPLQKKIEELEEKLQRQADSNRFNDLKSKYSDFDEVVNPDTLATLEEQEPELAAAICESKDRYKIAIQSYKYIKALGISKPSSRAMEIHKKLESNKKTVPTPQAYEKRPMAQAFKLSEEQKSQLYEEMMTCAAKSGFSY